MLHEKPQEGVINKQFLSKSEVVGWTNIGTTSRPITGIVIGRELRGLVSTDSGEIKMRVQTYVKPRGNDYLLSLVGGSRPHNGWSGTEFEITEDLSPEYAMTLSYSPTSKTLDKNEALYILPLILDVPLVMEESLGTRVLRTVHPSHQ